MTGIGRELGETACGCSSQRFQGRAGCEAQADDQQAPEAHPDCARQAGCESSAKTAKSRTPVSLGDQSEPPHQHLRSASDRVVVYHGAAFHARSLHYRALAEDPTIAVCAPFFAAAHVVTSVLALSHTTEFIAGLSRDLQAVNDERAQRVRARRAHVRGDWQSHTARFVYLEQQHVQRALDRLRARSPAQCLNEILFMNRNIRRASLWPTRLLSPAHAALYRSIHATRSVLHAWPDFAQQRHRELLGLHISFTAAEGRARLRRAEVRVRSDGRTRTSSI